MTRSLATFVALQIGWFACVLGGARGAPWLGPAVVAVLVGAHLAASDAPRHELAAVAAVALLGTAADSLQSRLGLLVFAGATGGPAGWLAPPWIAALWAHFATALRGPLAALDRRPLAAAGLGAIAAPPSYLAGARLGAVTLHPEVWPSVAAIALEWAILLPLALRLANRPPHAPPLALEAPR